MTRDEKDFHSSRSFVEQLESAGTAGTAGPSISQQEALEDKAMEFADPFPTMWSAKSNQTTDVWSGLPCSPHDKVRTDNDTPNIQQYPLCFESHPKLLHLNEVQLQHRGEVGRVYTDRYLAQMFPDLHPGAAVSSLPPPATPPAGPAGPGSGSSSRPPGPLAPRPPAPGPPGHWPPVPQASCGDPRAGQAWHSRTSLSRTSLSASRVHSSVQGTKASSR